MKKVIVIAVSAMFLGAMAFSLTTTTTMDLASGMIRIADVAGEGVGEDPPAPPPIVDPEKSADV